MCRNIRTLHNFEPPASDEEVQAAALQYVRKVSGSTRPSRANAEAFERAVEAVADITTRLLDELVTTAAPRDREVETARARARAAKRVAARARAFAASTSRSRGGAFVTSSASNSAEAVAILSTARSKAAALACEGFVKPLTLRTYCSAAARTSSSVADSGRRRVMMLRHMDSA